MQLLYKPPICSQKSMRSPIRMRQNDPYIQMAFKNWILIVKILQIYG